MSTATAARAVMTGLSVNFGLVSFQVDLVPARAPAASKAKVRSVCPTCEGAEPLRQEYHCEHGHGPFSIAEAAKAMDVDGVLVRTSAEAINEAKTATSQSYRTADLRVFPAEQVESALLPAGALYRLRPHRPAKTKVPSKGSEQAYALLYSLAGDSAIAFLTEVVVKKVSRMYRLIAHDGTLTLVELVRPEELAAAPPVELDCDTRVLDAAATLVSAMTEEFDPEEWKDEAQQRMWELRDRLADGQDVAEVTPVRPAAADAARTLIELLTKAA